MASNTSQPDTSSGAKTKLPPPNVVLPQFTSTVEQNVKPVVTEAQRIAAQTAYSGRKAVSRGTIFLAFYLWLLSGAILLSLIARYTQFFPGDKTIARNLQRQRKPWIRQFMIAISEVGFPRIGIPLTFSIAGIFWILRFRLQVICVLLTPSSNILNTIGNHLLKRARPTEQLVTVARVNNDPRCPREHGTLSMR